MLLRPCVRDPFQYMYILMNSVILRNNVLQSLQHRGHVLQSVVVAKTEPGKKSKISSPKKIFFEEQFKGYDCLSEREYIVNNNLSEENFAANWNLTETWPSSSKANLGKLIA